MRISTIGLIAAAGLTLGGCGYNGFGVGLGYGSDPYYSGYGYGSPYYGAYYGSRYGYNPYYGGYYGSPLGYGYGSPYGGWYNGYYYPGTGYYVYDRDRRRREMTAAERAYWRQRVASGVADRIRDRRGESVTTDGVTRQRVVTRDTRVRNNDVSSRRSSDLHQRQERLRDAMRARIESQRARKRD